MLSRPKHDGVMEGWTEGTTEALLLYPVQLRGVKFYTFLRLLSTDMYTNR